MKILLALIFMLSSLPIWGSALVRKDQEAGILNFYSHIYLYGEVTEELAQKISSEIETVWNNQTIQVALDGRLYKLRFHISASAESFENVLKIAQYTVDAKNNFVRLIAAPNEHLTASFMVGHTNSGVWLLSQGLGNSHTTAHEYGHSLGLDHPEGSSFSGYPRIMLTDYYEVGPLYQLASGKLDGSLRMITEVDVQELNLERLIFNDDNESSLGRFDFTFLFDEEGEIINF